MTKPVHFPDKAGYDLKPGDFIIYAHALGRCASLQYGVVLEVLPNKGNEFDYSDPPRPKLRVQGVELDDNWEWIEEHRAEKCGITFKAPRLLKPSILSFPSRVLRIQKEQVSANVLAALALAKLKLAEEK